jgi:hypothetical protein
VCGFASAGFAADFFAPPGFGSVTESCAPVLSMFLANWFVSLLETTALGCMIFAPGVPAEMEYPSAMSGDSRIPPRAAEGAAGD